MATVARQKTWVAGETLTAANLNAEFDNILTTLNGGTDAGNVDLTDDYTWTGVHVFAGTYDVPLRLGALRLWWDSTNSVVRGKASAPGTNLDGKIFMWG